MLYIKSSETFPRIVHYKKTYMHTPPPSPPKIFPDLLIKTIPHSPPPQRPAHDSIPYPNCMFHF